jgi:outer membrane protein OmpA-like peptidoglycan-associated protein
MSSSRARLSSSRWLLPACLAAVVSCGGTQDPAASGAGTTPPPERAADRDGDGLPDDMDTCPDDIEDYDSYYDADGCGDPDNDADGVSDAEDLCPNEPAWRSAAARDVDDARAGCPIAHVRVYSDGPPGDLDNDGYTDDVDRCPNHAESFPSTLDGGCTDDGDGCPDGTPILTINCEVMILDSLHFAPRSAAVAEQAERIVTAISTLLAVQEWSHLTVQVIGHADDTEPPGIGQRRADAVRDALVAAGVDAARLSTRDAGSTEPRAPTAGLRGRELATAREQNRRVGFQITHPRRLPGRPEESAP